MTQQLLPDIGSPFGSDLASINLARGRDHGLPSYTRFRGLCGFPEIKSFSDLQKYFRSGSAKLFEQNYKSVDDIDLFMGGMHEITLEEGILGPVFSCIVAEQFRRLKCETNSWLLKI